MASSRAAGPAQIPRETNTSTPVWRSRSRTCPATWTAASLTTLRCRSTTGPLGMWANCPRVRSNRGPRSRTASPPPPRTPPTAGSNQGSSRHSRMSRSGPGTSALPSASSRPYRRSASARSLPPGRPRGEGPRPGQARPSCRPAQPRRTRRAQTADLDRRPDVRARHAHPRSLRPRLGLGSASSTTARSSSAPTPTPVDALVLVAKAVIMVVRRGRTTQTGPSAATSLASRP